jgi:phosphopantothenoylcysteine decarboxylase / phosphopantothenate---cysteine ligase
MSTSIFKSKRVIITAGPTREAIDPVRYISNHSTGKMGYAIADYLLSLGADVHIISGPVSLNHNFPNKKITHVISADEMLEATKQLASDADVIIFTAAVADYKCAIIAEQKIKKKDNELSIHLVPNPDIAFELSKTKTENQLFIGFALETENGIENAFSKMKRKGFDSVILNIHNANGSGFGHDTNKIQIINNDFSVTDYGLKQKSDVAIDIVNHISTKLSIKEEKACYA